MYVKSKNVKDVGRYIYTIYVICTHFSGLKNIIREKNEKICRSFSSLNKLINIFT